MAPDSSAIDLVIDGRARDLGDGFMIRRVLPYAGRRTVGPFIFFDHIGPVDIGPERGMDVRPHPHIGLATVTYLFEGAIMHRDSLGCVQVIRPGDVNWMTAGRGIVHSERIDPELRREAGRVHGIQTWLALPQAHEETEPSFSHHPKDTLPSFTRGEVSLRLIAGRAFEHESPVRTFSRMFYLAAEMPAGSRLEMPTEGQEAAVYVASGEVELDGRAFGVGAMVVLASGAALSLQARAEARLLLLGGEPTDGTRFIWWNFVSSSRERLEQAKAAWREERFPAVPGDPERIPLPEG
ncbi:pirin family protein [Haliangium sp.]|uniref:pirin family protein n=1 Tax=Haliangium sp. TaxID=2663208 RepID=UPI003D0A5DC8